MRLVSVLVDVIGRQYLIENFAGVWAGGKVRCLKFTELAEGDAPALGVAF